MTKQEVIEKVKYWSDRAIRGYLRTPYKPDGRKERIYQLAWCDAMQNVRDLLESME